MSCVAQNLYATLIQINSEHGICILDWDAFGLLVALTSTSSYLLNSDITSIPACGTKVHISLLCLKFSYNCHLICILHSTLINIWYTGAEDPSHCTVVPYGVADAGANLGGRGHNSERWQCSWSWSIENAQIGIQICWVVSTNKLAICFLAVGQT